MWPFKRKEESSHEVADEEGLDEELRDVGWDEFYKEADLEASSNLDTAVMGPLALTGAMEGRRRRRRGLRKEAPEPSDEHGLRETLRDDDEKELGLSPGE